MASCDTGNLSNIFMNKRSFEDLVNSFENPERKEWQKPELVISMFGELKGKTVMDIGAGTGYFSFPMAERGATVIAADVDERFLDYVETKRSELNVSNVSTRKVEYDDPLLKNEEVDHVIIVNTYHHIDNRVDYFSKVLAGIKPGGSLMVVDFKKERSDFGPPKRYRVSAATAMDELKRAGFSTSKSYKEQLEYQYVVIAKK